MNVGSPDKPAIPQVWKYLTDFLNDKRVIDLPWLLRKFLVNFIIIPFRVKNSTGLYKRVWTENGSPLIHYSGEVKLKLENRLGENYQFFVGMRYGNPGYKKALEEIKKQGFEKLVVFPLFPQHAMSTTETAVKAVEKEVKKQGMDLEMKVVDQFYDHPGFIDAFVEQIRKYDPSKYDHIVFSYHGLPNRQLEKVHPGIKVKDCSCDISMPEHGKHCYRATCFGTTGLLVKALGLQKDDYTVAFQSRLSRNWMSPFTDEILLEKLREGKKRILVVAPAFVADCLETIIELGYEYREMFIDEGGEDLQMVESLNAEPMWIDAMETLLKDTVKR